MFLRNRKTSSSNNISGQVETSGTLVHLSAVWSTCWSDVVFMNNLWSKILPCYKEIKPNYAQKLNFWEEKNCRRFSGLMSQNPKHLALTKGSFLPEELKQGWVLKDGGRSLQVWGCSSVYGVGDLVRMNGLAGQILIHHVLHQGFIWSVLNNSKQVKPDDHKLTAKAIRKKLQ